LIRTGLRSVFGRALDFILRTDIERRSRNEANSFNQKIALQCCDLQRIGIRHAGQDRDRFGIELFAVAIKGIIELSFDRFATVGVIPSKKH